jgi:anti-sigma B factor antagonist
VSASDEDSHSRRAPFSVAVVPTHATACIDVTGELDLATAPQLKTALDALASNDTRHVLIDLRGLQFIDSSGLRTLLGPARSQRQLQSLIRPRSGAHPTGL